MNLIRPIITEKSLQLAETENKYTFYVKNGANKIEVAKEVGSRYGVNVISVNIANYLGKKVAFGRKRIPGRKSGYKKAIVTVKPGDTIADFNIS
ncbi:50S ribosomal protein L23 [Candidatus Dojkabacteria bacterium]|uniref:Large ribosomal subunit protein uL23 n=1 Tax=Candidatus Dojkabacteria bacterium TaxID=2099670 RepID=A0A955RKI3_9BACT|nr:50S ribosomal protein L23 [Candidatus Dojkabacteria bacterium]